MRADLLECCAWIWWDALLGALCHACQHHAVARAHIFAQGAKPHGLCLKIIFLVICKMSIIDVVGAPPVVVGLLRALEVAQAEA